jgi:hypothetical protein
MRVAFLLNHYAVHQVPHVVPYAFELSRTYPDLDVVIACSSKQELTTARAISLLTFACSLVLRTHRPACLTVEIQA